MNIKSAIKAVRVYSRYKPVGTADPSQQKFLYLDISQNPFSRYLYLFVKFFHLQGYAVHMPRHPRLMYQLVNDHYASLLLKEQLLVFGKPPRGKEALIIDENILTPDYFNYFGQEDLAGRSLLIPMTQHPLMYHAGFWDTAIADGHRKRSVFMAGNFDKSSYHTIDEGRIFDVLSRPCIYDKLKQSGMLYNIKDETALHQFLTGMEDNKVLLVNRLIHDIPMHELRNLLSKFDYYFALPGVVMPLCHNIVEAMSAGCIPFLQENYAAYFRPKLQDGITAVTFKDEKDMHLKLQMLFQMQGTEIDRMKAAVSSYYQNNLTPNSLVKAIETGRYSKLYLQAEHVSVALLKNRLEIIN